MNSTDSAIKRIKEAYGEDVINTKNLCEILNIKKSAWYNRTKKIIRNNFIQAVTEFDLEELSDDLLIKE